MGRKLIFRLFAVVLLSCLVLSGQAPAADEKTQYFPVLAYRTGPFAAGGSGFSSGLEDFMELRNLQGGVNGIKYSWEECETAYNTARGIGMLRPLERRCGPGSPFEHRHHLCPDTQRYRGPYCDFFIRLRSRRCLRRQRFPLGIHRRPPVTGPRIRPRSNLSAGKWEAWKN